MDMKLSRRILQQVERPKARSPLFHWLFENHDELIARAPGGRISWKEICITFAEVGLTDTRGQAPSPALAKLTWQRVRKAVLQARARQAALKPSSGPAPPARGRAPPLSLSGHVAQAPAPLPVTPAVARPRAPPVFGSDDPNLTAEQRANLLEAEEAIDRAFAPTSALRRLT